MGTNDASVLAKSEFGKAFAKNSTVLQLPTPAPHGNKIIPYVLIGDDIFPLKAWLMKPFPWRGLSDCERVYTYRLSRARRTIENAFGILSAKWRIFRRPIRANVDLVEKITKSTICLHNYLRLTENAGYIPAGFVDREDGTGNIVPGDWIREVELDSGHRVLNRLGGNRYGFDAGEARD